MFIGQWTEGECWDDVGYGQHMGQRSDISLVHDHVESVARVWLLTRFSVHRIRGISTGDAMT